MILVAFVAGMVVGIFFADRSHHWLRDHRGQMIVQRMSTREAVWLLREEAARLLREADLLTIRERTCPERKNV